MAKCSFKFQLAKECGIRNKDVVSLGKFILAQRCGYRGEVKLARYLVECGQRGAGRLTMADIGLLEMIIHGFEQMQPILPTIGADVAIRTGNILIEVARKFADMDYEEFDRVKA